MRSPILNWAFGIVAVLGLPLGVIVALSYGSLFAGLGSMIIVVFVVLLACRKDILREYHQRNKRPGEKPNT
jgi:ABC-type transporter Mla maintaining outer membrane lipid asymmetry permease subunit MlaE